MKMTVSVILLKKQRFFRIFRPEYIINVQRNTIPIEKDVFIK